ncbi:MAG: hypothetical protein U1D31_00515 [Patescibacteria group bacterium]|nr:hypothetical protein [bacterium]MDZ4240604.1 hypothetical protein [Patescibacteria group bacterium]
MTQSTTATAPQETEKFPEKTHSPVSPTASPSETSRTTSKQTERKAKAEKEKFIFLKFQRTGADKTARWETERKIENGKKIRYFINEKCSTQPTSELETWACKTFYEFQYNEWVRIVIVDPVVKTALAFGKEQVLTFHTNDGNSVLPKWNYMERVDGVVVKRVPLREGPQPSAQRRSWETREIVVIACEQGGQFQIIGVKLIRPVSTETHLDSKQIRRIKKTQKNQNIKKSRSVSGL